MLESVKASMAQYTAEELITRRSEVSDKIKRGKHTTRHAELLKLECGGMVADTPMGMGKVVSVDVFKKTYSVDLKEKGIVVFSKDDIKNGSSK